MIPLRVLVVDDEPPARSRARRMLSAIEGVEVVAEAGDSVAARREIQRHSPDLLLLDIQMPGEDGFELLRSLEPRPAVIFATAFDRYAVQAFEENAVDYLLKPYRQERLAEAVERARRELARPKELAARLEQLLQAVGGGLPESAGHLTRFTVRVGTRQKVLRQDEVFWFLADEKLVILGSETDRHYVNFTLEQLESRLDPAKFLRVHRSAIVHLDHVASLRPRFAGTWVVEMRDRERTELPVSRARARALRERLGG